MNAMTDEKASPSIVATATGYLVGVDIGGTHVTAAAVDAERGELLASSVMNVSVDSKGAADEILAQWCGAVRDAMQSAGDNAAGIGIAMPGPFDYENGISLIRGLDKYESLYGVNVRERMKSELGTDKSIIFRNDAQCFLLGESWSGAAAGCRNAIGITLGTGFGSAFLKGGVCVVDGEGVPEHGWFYHVPFRDGIAEEYFSARGFLRAYSECGGAAVSNVRELAERARSEARALRTFEEFGKSLGEFLSPFVGKFGAERVVVGGNIARAWELFAPALQKRMRESGQGADVVATKLFERAALIGAARLPLLYTAPAQ